jgi:hypothetical protein
MTSFLNQGAAGGRRCLPQSDPDNEKCLIISSFRRDQQTGIHKRANVPA